MSPPITPPEKRPDRHYNFGRMNMWFAVSSLALLATTLWMVVADYAQPWKKFQAEFRELEQDKLLKDLKDESGKIEGQRKQLRAEIRAAEKGLASHRGEIEKLEARIRELKSKRDEADSRWRAAKAQLDASRFEYDAAIQADKDAREHAERVQEAKKALGDARTEREGYEKRGRGGPGRAGGAPQGRHRRRGEARPPCRAASTAWRPGPPP